MCYRLCFDIYIYIYIYIRALLFFFHVHLFYFLSFVNISLFFVYCIFYFFSKKLPWEKLLKIFHVKYGANWEKYCCHGPLKHTCRRKAIYIYIYNVLFTIFSGRGNEQFEDWTGYLFITKMHSCVYLTICSRF